MANPSLESFTSRGMVLKKETVEGTDAAPTPALDAFQILDGKSKLNATAITRAIDRPYFNSKRTKYTNFYVSIDGTIELVPPAAPGVDDASVGLALEIAGMAKVLTTPAVGPPIVPGVTAYNMISRAIPTATGYWWHSGTYREMLGARANLTGLSMEVGKYYMAQVHFEGGCIDITEDDLPTDFDFAKFLVPTDASPESMDLTINDFAVNGTMLSVDFANALKTKQHTNARVSRITSRSSTFKAQFYRSLLADFDPYAKWRSGDLIEVVGTLIESDGRFTRKTITAEVTDVSEANIEEDYGFEITGNLVAVDGNDELLVEFSEGAA